MMKVLIDTWGWVSLYNKREKRHEEVKNWYRDFRSRRGIAYTTDYVLDETFTLLFRRTPFEVAAEAIAKIDDAVEKGYLLLERITPKRFENSCQLCELVSIASERAIIVAAAGNNGPEEDSVSCPANSESCVCVGSIEKDGTVSSYSSRGSQNHLKPDIIAPGCIRYGNFKLEGTSIATPFVSASAALLLSVDMEDKRRVIDAILGTAADKGFPRWVQGHGLIRANKALEVIL